MSAHDLLESVLSEMRACFDGTSRPVPPPDALHRWCSNLTGISAALGGLPEPAECELEAIAALFTSALSQVGNWQDRARYLFERGVRIQDGAALERPRPALPAATIHEIIRRIQDALPHGEHSQIAPLYPTWEAAARIFDALRLYFEPPYAGAALPPQTGNPPPDATNFGLLTCALELLAANEREYAPSNAATDWYLRDQRVIALLREVLLRGNL